MTLVLISTLHEFLVHAAIVSPHRLIDGGSLLTVTAVSPLISEYYIAVFDGLISCVSPI